MSKQETDIQNRIRLAEAKHGRVLFRNSKGMFLTLDGKRKVHAGLLVDGSSDLIGFTPVKITEKHIGQTLAVFTAIEIKVPDSEDKRGGVVHKDQQDFIDNIRRLGGFAGVARSPEDARKI